MPAFGEVLLAVGLWLGLGLACVLGEFLFGKFGSNKLILVLCFGALVLGQWWFGHGVACFFLMAGFLACITEGTPSKPAASKPGDTFDL
jgi:hypothetical protein